jgi:two-component system, cell cycle response regulator
MSSSRSSLLTQLDYAHMLGREECMAGLSTARQVESEALASGYADIRARAVAYQGQMLLSQGEIAEACEVATRLELVGPLDDEPFVVAAVATFRTQLAFFLGAYRDAITYAAIAIATADATGDAGLRAAVRNQTCFVLGNIEAPSVRDVIEERMLLGRATDDRWEVAMSHNDRATMYLGSGDVGLAAMDLSLADQIANTVDGPTLALRAVIEATRAQLFLAQGALDQASECALGVVRVLEQSVTPHPYILSMASVIAVEALAAQGRIDEAILEGRLGVRRLGEFLPFARSAILGCLATGLRAAGRLEQAYDALAESVALERRAARQFSALQHDLIAVAAEHTATRVEVDTLRDEADRDWLTGLHNRRFLARLQLAAAKTVGVALVDLDNFKAVNDTYGHEIGDRVLTRVAQVLVGAARAEDAVVRLGGDEFVIVMAGADRDRALACAHRLHEALALEDWSQIGPDVAVGASVGFTAGPATTPIDELISRADRYLYAVKQSGRGQVAGTAHTV